MANEEKTPARDSAAAATPTPVIPTPVRGRKRSTGPTGPERINGLGRRKTAVARVHLSPGEGRWSINGRTLQDYFPRGTLQQSVVRPLVVTESEGRFDVLVRVVGGGLRGQADAVRLGLARALLKVDEAYRPRLRTEALLTRDAREVERKKPGRPKARKRFQFSKR
jgi:small subunit ribosomal protein S9